MNTPSVTVLMSVFNGEKFLKEAVESILKQTFKDFIFLIIDDASNDQSSQIIKTYSDGRIQFIQNKSNLGLAASLNLGLSLCKTPYIARMDADDISLPHRLKVQYEWMQKHPEVGVCGTFMKELNGKKYWTPSTDSQKIHAELIFNCPLNHPTVIMRSSFLEKHGLKYHPELRAGQDYLLWCQCSDFFKLANLPKMLLHYRVHSQQTGTSQKSNQEAAAKQIRLMQLKKMGLTPTEQQYLIHEALALGKISPALDKTQAEEWINQILIQNQKKLVFPQKALSKLLQQRKNRLFRKKIFFYI